MSDNTALTDQQIVEQDAQTLYIGNTGTVEFDLNLPTEGKNGSAVSWQTSDDRWIKTDGTVHMPEYGRGDRNVTLTATLTYGEASATREFTVKVLEQANKIKVKEFFPIEVTVGAGSTYELPMFAAVRTDDDRLISQRINWDDGVEHQAGEPGDVSYHGVIDGSTIEVTGTVHVVDHDPNAPVDAAPKVKALPIDHVRLTGEGFLARNQARRIAYLKTVDDDQLLVEFRTASGLDTKGAPLMIGWDAPDSLLRGHTTGHFISAYALAYAASGDETIKSKLDYVVDSLAEVQRAFAAKPGFHPGFLSAYSERQFDELEKYAPYPTIWAPYYTLHKILAGLIDAYNYAGNETALDVASKVGDWVYDRLSKLPHEQLQNMWSMYIAGEFGGMNESLANLYAITRNPKHLAAARLFDNDRLMVPMRQHVDALGGMHANQHIPQVIGSVKLFEQTGVPYYLEQAKFFYESVTGHHLYALGGTGQGEMFHQPDEIGNLIFENTAESCASYNMLKLAAELYQYFPQAQYGDYYELTTLNHIAATTDHVPEGGSLYFFQTQPGGQKSFDVENSCCHGTGLESHFYYAQGAYYTDADALYVRLYLNGTLDDEAAKLSVHVDDLTPEHVRIDVERLAKSTLRLRVPGWSAGKVAVKVNGQPLGALVVDAARTDSDELAFTAGALGLASWDGASVELDFEPHMHLAPTPDRPELAAVEWGPYVLAALSESTDYLDVPVDGSDPDAAFEREEGTLTFTHKATGLKFVPLEQINEEHYHAYVRVK